MIAVDHTCGVTIAAHERSRSITLTADVIAMFSAEFLIVGAAAGLTGSLLASGFAYVVLRRFFEDAPFRFDAVAVAISALATALLASAAGWVASFGVLGQKPLEVLRGE